MGLREVKIERTRAQIVEAAQNLFLGQGYATTTMEQVAETAEVGTSTLYRYFPSKELLLLEPFRQALRFGPLLEERPAHEPLEDSLGAVVRAAFPQGDLEHDRFVALWHMVESNAGPRARLWDVGDQAAGELEQGIARRLGCPADDLRVVLTARNLLEIHGLVSRRWTGRTRRSWEQTVDRVLEALPGVAPVVPR